MALEEILGDHESEHCRAHIEALTELQALCMALEEILGNYKSRHCRAPIEAFTERQAQNT